MVSFSTWVADLHQYRSAEKLSKVMRESQGFIVTRADLSLETYLPPNQMIFLSSYSPLLRLVLTLMYFYLKDTLHSK